MRETIVFIAAALMIAAMPAGPARGGEYHASDSLRAEQSDPFGPADQAKMDSLQARFNGGRYTGRFAGLLFVQPMADAEAGRAAVKSEAPYLPFAGLVIRRIEIVRYDIFGDHPVGVRDPDDPWFIRLINAAHVDTREGKIRRFLLMREGEPLDPFALSDTERLLRETAFIQDARLTVSRVPESPDSVDILVVTRDVWSLGLNVSIDDYDRYGVKIYERNLAGYGHTLEYEADLDLSRDRLADHIALYRAVNIWGSFVDGEARYVDSNDEISNRWALSRGYVSPEIRWTGGSSVEGVKVREKEGLGIVRQYDRQDAWIGYSVPLAEGAAGGISRRRIIPAVRATRYDYHLRPPDVGPDRYRGYHDRTTYLAKATLTRRSFRTSRYIFSFGQSEDIPEGFKVSVTGGYQDGEFLGRGYAGAGLGYGRFGGNLEYRAANLEVGSYFRDGESEDGVLSLTLGTYSRLVPFARGAIRHFAVLTYAFGFNRLPDSQVALEGRRGGILGLGGEVPEGKQRLMLGYEGSYFMPWDWWGFRFALFAFAQAGQVGSDWDSFVREKYWSSFGGGLRFHNERLIFSAYEIRLMYHPSVPEGADTKWFRFGAVRSLDIPFLTPTAPSTVRYE
jgi:hypothetical protein